MPKLTEGGAFIVMGIPATLDDATRRTIREVQPGGFILFGRNIGLPPIADAQGNVGIPGSPGKLRHFLDELRGLVDHEPVITIDQEGGRVSRLRGLEGGAEPPSARALAEKGDPDLIAEHGKLTGQLLRLFGININLCPVLDIAYDHNADNSVQNRCYGSTPREVARNAGAFMRAMRGEGILSTGKHFPGYSRANVDPHHELPVVNRSRAQMEADEWIPYRELLDELDCIMTGHAVYPQLDDSGLPTSLSPKIIRSILREDWQFSGPIISDDLDMGAVTRYVTLEDSVQRAVSAGTDLVLLCHDVERVKLAAHAISLLPADIIKAGHARLEKLRARLAKPASFSPEVCRQLNAAIQSLRQRTLGPDAPPFTPGAGKIGVVEAAALSPVNVVGDTAIGAPAEYQSNAQKKT